MDFPIFSDYSKKTPRKGSGLYYDPLYGYVPLPSYCREAMDLEVFQRLRGIKQLSTVYLTFPGAVHTRFDHCVGTSHLALIMFNKLRELVNQNEKNAPKINHITEACMQLSSLFHDIGHGPFGHIFEMFCKRREKFRKWRHEKFGRKLLEMVEREGRFLIRFKPCQMESVSSIMILGNCSLGNQHKSLKPLDEIHSVLQSGASYFQARRNRYG